MKLIWLDLETEGLDPKTCAILEVAAAVADFERPFDVKMLYHAVLRYRPEEEEVRLQDANPYVFDMHTKSGLLAECLRSDKRLVVVEAELLDLIPEVASKEDKPVLAGSSIHFDHNFLKVHMPTLDKRLSHRHYDVSSVKLFCKSLGMPSFDQNEAAHRAKEDIAVSIEHAKRCAAWSGR